MVDGSGSIYICDYQIKLLDLILNALVSWTSLDLLTWVHFRRNAFWVAKQVLQLGMGDAFDDWLIEKIQRLRRGSVVAAGIRRIEQASVTIL